MGNGSQWVLSLLKHPGSELVCYVVESYKFSNYTIMGMPEIPYQVKIKNAGNECHVYIEENGEWIFNANLTGSYNYRFSSFYEDKEEAFSHFFKRMKGIKEKHVAISQIASNDLRTIDSMINSSDIPCELSRKEVNPFNDLRGEYGKEYYGFYVPNYLEYMGISDIIKAPQKILASNAGANELTINEKVKVVHVHQEKKRGYGYLSRGISYFPSIGGNRWRLYDLEDFEACVNDFKLVASKLRRLVQSKHKYERDIIREVNKIIENAERR